MNAAGLLELPKEAVKKAGNPAAALAGAKDQMLAEVERVQADLAYRVALAQPANLSGKG
jgi:hypothetical protein